MLDDLFCEFLEFEITKTLSNSKDPTKRGFWCDGILLPDIENTNLQKVINDNRQIELTAFFGLNGQETYKMTIFFGPKSLSKNASGSILNSCVPFEEDNWIQFDTTKKEIEILLK